MRRQRALPALLLLGAAMRAGCVALNVPPVHAWPRYLVVFRAKFGPCRIEELRSALCAVMGDEVPKWALDGSPAYGDKGRLVETCSDIGPPVFHSMRFPSADVARAAARRCACVRAVLEVWAEGATDAECSQMAASLSPERIAELHAPMADGGGWAVHFHAHGLGKKGGSGLTLQERKARLARLGPLLVDIKGPVVLAPSAPSRKHTLWLVDDFDPPIHSEGGTFKARGTSYVALCRLVAEGAAAEVHTSRLSAREALHITSLPADLALMMANFARVRPGDVVLDPFCGTGSTLIGAALVARIHRAEMGELGTAAAADARTPSARLLHAIGLDIDECVHALRANFAQLGLGADADATVFQADIAALRGCQPPLSELPPVHAIVCDPPYGIMILPSGELARTGGEAARALGAAAGGEAERAARAQLACLEHLFALAHAVLADGGRLCFLLPAPFAVERIESVLPPSGRLRLDGAARMAFTAKQYRWLVTMVMGAREQGSGDGFL